MIEPEPVQQVDRTYVLWRRRKLSYFSGCDYFRLSSHPKVQRSLTDGLRRFGLNVAASRLTSGNHVLYTRLERQLARFFKAESALLVSSGYVANLAVAQALTSQFSHALLDTAAHPSLMDAALALGCPILKFAHRSPAQLSQTVARCGEGCKPIVLTDGLFSRDGSAAPLKDYLAVLPGDAVLLVDDAHGAGVLGTCGRGTLEHAGINRRRVIQTITLSKAFGVYGGAILASRSLRQRMVARSQVVIGSTPLPLPLVSAAGGALQVLVSEKCLRSRLLANAVRVRNALRTGGLPVEDHPGPIIALQPKRRSGAASVKRALWQADIFPPYIIYPGGPPAGYFRFVISSEHSTAQLDRLAKSLLGTARLLIPLN